jgi:hypothetical protein
MKIDRLLMIVSYRAAADNQAYVRLRKPMTEAGPTFDARGVRRRGPTATNLLKLYSARAEHF